MEQYLTYPTDAFLQDRIAEGILQTLIEVGPGVVKIQPIILWLPILCGAVRWL